MGNLCRRSHSEMRRRFFYATDFKSAMQEKKVTCPFLTRIPSLQISPIDMGLIRIKNAVKSAARFIKFLSKIRAEGTDVRRGFRNGFSALLLYLAYYSR